MEEYEIIQQENSKTIQKFKEYLSKNGVGEKTIKKHISDVDLLVNDYLALDEESRPEELDAYTLECFFRWCIDKWMFNTASGIVSALSSIRIFYEYLNEEGKVRNIDDILGICRHSEIYVKQYNRHEKLLNKHGRK